MTDDKADVVNRFEYLPYGESWVTEGDGKNRAKYNSQELDAETNFYFYNARYYDLEVSRFVTADSVVPDEYSSQSWNGYSYCRNNPITYKDPTGHWEAKDLDIAAWGSGDGGKIDGVSRAETSVNYAGSNKTVDVGKGETAKDEPTVIDLKYFKKSPDAKFCKNVPDFENKKHYKESDQKNKVDLNSDHSPKMEWYGPNAPFKIKDVILGEGGSGSRVKIGIWDKDKKKEIAEIDFLHMNQIEKSIYDVCGKKTFMNAGAFVGVTDKKMGLTTGAYLHAETDPKEIMVMDKLKVEFNQRKTMEKLLRGE